MGEFCIGVCRLHSGFPEPHTSSDNLSLGLYLISQTVKDLKIDYHRSPLWMPSLEDVSDMKKFPQGAPESEMYPNLAETLRQNPMLQVFACLEGEKVRTALSTYYRGGNPGNGSPYPSAIIYVEGDNFHPEILDRINFPKHNIETFFAGKEAEHMLRIREERLVKKD